MCAVPHLSVPCRPVAVQVEQQCEAAKLKEVGAVLERMRTELEHHKARDKEAHEQELAKLHERHRQDISDTKKKQWVSGTFPSCHGTAPPALLSAATAGQLIRQRPSQMQSNPAITQSREYENPTAIRYSRIPGECS